MKDLAGDVINLVSNIPSVPQALGKVLGSIPGLASGGIVTKPTLAVVGEGGEPEAVIPLSQLGNYGGGQQEVVVKLDVAPDLADILTARVNRVNGRTSQEDPSFITRIGEY